MLSIPLIMLILFSGITVNFATHYCGGSVAATKVSLNGELATCGMENNATDNNSTGDFYSSHCCDDVTAFYSLNCNYIPSFSFVIVLSLQNHFLTERPVDIAFNNTPIISSCETIRPPGTNNPNSVDRPVLCVFQI